MLFLSLRWYGARTEGGEEKKAREKRDAWGSCVCCFFLFVLGACCPCLRLFLAAGGSETKFFELCGAPVGRQKKGPEEPPKSERQGQTGTRRKGEGRMKKPRRYTPGTPPTPRKSFFSRSAPLRTGRCSVCLLAASKQANKAPPPVFPGSAPSLPPTTFPTIAAVAGRTSVADGPDSLTDSLRGSSVKIGTTQRRLARGLAWPLRKDDTHKSGNVLNFLMVLSGTANSMRCGVLHPASLPHEQWRFEVCRVFFCKETYAATAAHMRP